MRVHHVMVASSRNWALITHFYRLILVNVLLFSLKKLLRGLKKARNLLIALHVSWHKMALALGHKATTLTKQNQAKKHKSVKLNVCKKSKMQKLLLKKLPLKK